MSPPRKEVVRQKRKWKKSKCKASNNCYQPLATCLDVDEQFFISNDDTTFSDTTDFDYSSGFDDIGTMSDSDSDPFDWNDNNCAINDWWSDPAYSSLEGNIFHHHDD